MGDADEGAGRGRVVVLRVVSAVVAVASLAALATNLVDKAGSPAEQARATPSPEPSERRRKEPERPQPVPAGGSTVYDFQGGLDRCAIGSGGMAPASRGPGLGDDIRSISARVERLRRLGFTRRVDTTLVSRTEVGERFVRGYFRRYSGREAARDEQVLEALRLIPEGTDLRTLTSQFLAQGVAGFYNPRSDRLFAGSTGDALTPYDEVVLAHELGHALVEQELGLPRTLARNRMLADTMLAHQALAEGDASLVMGRYSARRFTPEAHDAFMARFTQKTVAPSPTIPYFLARASEFPYYEGLLFVCREWNRRGWDGVDALYARPPATTAQVLFPTRYLEDDAARLPAAPGLPGPRWKAVPASSFGAFDLMLLLENADLLSAGETVPGSHVNAVRGWAGGVLRAWLRGPKATIHLALVDAGVATERGPRRRLCRVVRGWLHETFPDASPAGPRDRSTEAWRMDGDLAALRCNGPNVELAKGPSKIVRRVLRG